MVDDPRRIIEKLRSALQDCLKSLNKILNESDPEDDLFSTEQAAKFLRTSIQTLRRLKKSGVLVPKCRRGAKYLYYDRRQLEEYLEAGVEATPQSADKQTMEVTDEAAAGDDDSSAIEFQ